MARSFTQLQTIATRCSRLPMELPPLKAAFCCSLLTKIITTRIHYCKDTRRYCKVYNVNQLVIAERVNKEDDSLCGRSIKGCLCAHPDDPKYWKSTVTAVCGSSFNQFDQARVCVPLRWNRQKQWRESAYENV